MIDTFDSLFHDFNLIKFDSISQRELDLQRELSTLSLKFKQNRRDKYKLFLY